MSNTFKKEDGSSSLVRCPECREYCVFNESSGICQWCGFDVNEEE